MNEEEQEYENHALKESTINEEKQEHEDDVVVPTMMNGVLGVNLHDLTRIDKANATTTDMEDDVSEENEIGKEAGKLLGLNSFKARYPT